MREKPPRGLAAKPRQLLRGAFTEWTEDRMRWYCPAPAKVQVEHLSGCAYMYIYISSDGLSSTMRLLRCTRAFAANAASP
jgi:hypothetical protein